MPILLEKLLKYIKKIMIFTFLFISKVFIRIARIMVGKLFVDYWQ